MLRIKKYVKRKLNIAETSTKIIRVYVIKILHNYKWWVASRKGVTQKKSIFAPRLKHCESRTRGGPITISTEIFIMHIFLILFFASPTQPALVLNQYGLCSICRDMGGLVLLLMDSHRHDSAAVRNADKPPCFLCEAPNGLLPYFSVKTFFIGSKNAKIHFRRAP